MFTAMLVVGLVLAMVLPALAISKARKEIENEEGSYTDILKIKVEHPGNSSHLYIATNVAIYDGEKYLHDIRHYKGEGPKIFKDLLAIPGVTCIGMVPLDHKYGVSLQKGDAFTFEEDIIPAAIKIIAKYYGAGKNVEILPTEDNRQKSQYSDYNY